MKSLLIFLSLNLIISPSIGQDRDHEPPANSESVKVGSGIIRVFNKTERLKGSCTFHPLLDCIKLKWEYRPNATYEFKRLIQEAPISFKVLEVLPASLNWLYVVGVNPQNENTIVVKWEINHSDMIWHDPIEKGDPTWTKSKPRIKRTQIYNSDKIAHRFDLCVDPQGRFLLLFGQEKKIIYKMDLEDGSTQALFDPTDNEDIADHLRIWCNNHKTEGYIYLLTPKRRSSTQISSLVPVVQEDGRVVHYEVSDTVIFRDANMDGVIDPGSLQSMTKEQYVDAGYHDINNFVH